MLCDVPTGYPCQNSDEGSYRRTDLLGVAHIGAMTEKPRKHPHGIPPLFWQRFSVGLSLTINNSQPESPLRWGFARLLLLLLLPPPRGTMKTAWEKGKPSSASAGGKGRRRRRRRGGEGRRERARRRQASAGHPLWHTLTIAAAADHGPAAAACGRKWGTECVKMRYVPRTHILRRRRRNLRQGKGLHWHRECASETAAQAFWGGGRARVV
jgi:hypothetical protein